MVSVYQSYFQPTDESIPYRLVGSYEYVKALDQFSRLIEKSTTDELQVYDRVLNDRAEFSFFNGINAAFEQLPDLTQATPVERNQFRDKFMKKGLPWMMALARIELAATSSLYGEVESPFEALVTTEFGVEQYLSILKDDVVAHMKSLSQEPGFKEVLRRARKADTWTLAYLRRVKLIRDMLRTLERAGGPEVAAEIEPLAYELKKHQRELIDQVRTEVASNSSEYTATNKSTSVRSSGSTSVGKCDRFINNNFSSPGSSSSSTPATGGGSSRLVRGK